VKVIAWKDLTGLVSE